jgi:arylsulfatase A-like enzyme
VARKYAAEVSGVDDGVGRVVEALHRCGLTDQTLVVFTADQGLAGGHAGYWGMGDHTRPLTAFDWTMSIPLIFSQPGRVTAGRRVDAIVSNYDLLPTILSQLGLGDAMPTTPERPGRDFSPMLRGQPLDWEEIHFFEFENVRAVRTPTWKYIERIHQTPNELYDLTTDPEEHRNLYGDPEQAPRVLKLRRRLYAFFDTYTDPQWDLWRGGDSKTQLLTGRFFGISGSTYGQDAPPPPVQTP